MKKIFIVKHIDFEDPAWSDVEFIGTTKDECYGWIDENVDSYR